jgi:hypothetical protein
MFVRWKRYGRKWEWCDGPGTLQAVLVECHRFNGRPRQKIIATLGTIKEDAIERQKEGAIALFLLSVRRNLERIKVAPEDQAKIDEALYQRLGEWDQQREVDLLKQFYETCKHNLSRNRLLEIFPISVILKIFSPELAELRRERESGI